MQFVLFTDNLKDLGVREVCRAAKQAGFDGLDLTVRPGGHVLPENAATGIPAAQEIADQEGVAIPMVSTMITDPASPHAEDIIAAAHGRNQVFKMGYYRYEPFNHLDRQLDDARRRLEALLALTRRYGIRPCLHVHSGANLSNSVLLHRLLKDFPPADVGAYVDPMHMTLEGGLSGWEIALDLLTPWVALVGVKNFVYQPAGRDAFGQQRFNWKFAPLADGIAPLPQFFKRLKQIGYDGVVSLHSEYKGASSWRALDSPQLLAQSAADLAYLKGVLAKI